MKLLAIHVNNLNSLYGEHSVDLERELHDAPLFLIVGPTGAGKSTLMDAVSLALFGATSRLSVGNRTQGVDDWDVPDDPRHVMSRGCVKASARVEFRKTENGVPVRYAATWQCHRARRRPDGTFQKPLRLLDRFDPATQAWVQLTDGTRASDYEPVFADVLDGLTLADFHRCMVLPQGEFSAFLKAPPGERASILERLTDTAAYKLYGERAATRKRLHDEALLDAKGAMARLDAPDASTMMALSAEEDASRQALDAQRAEHARLAVWVAWCWADASHARDLAMAESAVRDVEDERARSSADLARLAVHERCADARGLLAKVEALASALSDHEARGAALAGSLRVQSESAATAQATCEDRERERATAERARDEAASAIAEARAVWAEIGSARESAARAVNEREAAAVVVATRSTDAALARAAVDTATTRLEAAESTLQACARDAPLESLLPAWRERARAIATAAAGLRRYTARLDEHAARDVARGVRRSAIDARSVEAASAERLHRERVDTADRALREALGEARDLATFRRATEAAASTDVARTHAMDSLAIALSDHATVVAQRADLAVQIEVAGRAAHEASEATDGAERAIRTCDDALAALRLRLEELRFARELTQRRHLLRHDEPCPLCGSLEHPYVHDAAAAEVARVLAERASVLDAEASALDGQRERARVTRDEARLAATEAQSRRAAGERELARVCATLDEAAKRTETLRAKLGLDAPVTAEALERHAAELNTRQRERTVARHRVDAAESDMQRERALWNEARARVDAVEAERATLEIEAVADERARAALGADRDVLAAQRRADEEGLRAALANHAIREESLEVAMARATARATAAADARAGHEAATRALDLAVRESAGADARREDATILCASAIERAATAESHVAALAARCGTLLEGRDPDLCARELQSRLDATSEAVSAAALALSRAREALAATSGAHRAALDRLDELRRDLATQRTALASARAAVEMPHDDALRATALDEPSRTRLDAMRRDLAARTGASATLLADRAQRLAAHRAHRPADLADRVDLSALEARATQVRDDIARMEATLADVTARRVRGESLRAQAARVEASVAEAAEQSALSNRLHQLIGVRNGESFRQFAQALNLDELIERANEHLARLAPRYQLARAPSAQDGDLLFAIRDDWHAGATRPVGTLSGGETFLVSLALALALANYRTVRLPIETLLLDEGFGALDPAALDVAMDAIETLHVHGMQVGIISHVAALRDRIDARIVIEPLGAGRSKLRVEYGPTGE